MVVDGMGLKHGMLQGMRGHSWSASHTEPREATSMARTDTSQRQVATDVADEDSLIPVRQSIPADAPPIRVNAVDPKEAKAQAVVDNDVLEAWNEWKDAGKPALFNRSPRQLYTVPQARQKRTVEIGRA